MFSQVILLCLQQNTTSSSGWKEAFLPWRRPEHLVQTSARFLTLLLQAGNTRTFDFMSKLAEKLSLHYLSVVSLDATPQTAEQQHQS